MLLTFLAVAALSAFVLLPFPRDHGLPRLVEWILENQVVFERLVEAIEDDPKEFGFGGGPFVRALLPDDPTGLVLLHALRREGRNAPGGESCHAARFPRVESGAARQLEVREAANSR